MPSVSIIIPAYNSMATIVEALESVAAQTVTDVEVIVVDDASTDNTVEIVRQWIEDRGSGVGGWTIVTLSKNGGPAAARNLGIARARGDWIAFLDADDLWPRARLDVQLQAAAADPEIVLWCGRAVRFDAERHKEQAAVLRDTPQRDPLVGQGRPRPAVPMDEPCEAARPEAVALPSLRSETAEGRRNRIASRRLALDEFALHNPVATSTVLVRRTVLQACGGFDEQFRGPEDYDLWMRVVSKGPAAFLEADLAWYAQRQGSLSMDDRTFLPQVIRVLDKAFAPGGALYGRRDLRRRALANQYWNASWMAFQRGARGGALRHLAQAVLLQPGVGGRRQLPLWWRYLAGKL